MKRYINIILIISILITGLSSCGVQSSNNIEAGTVVRETGEAITIIDQAGREVTVSKNPDSIALCYRVVIRFLLNLELGEKITGIGKSEAFLEEVCPELKEATCVGQGIADIEALAELAPDLFIHKADDIKTLEAVTALGIPALGITVETPEDMKTALRILGCVCDRQQKAETLIDYYDNKLESFERLTENIDKDSRKTAIMMGTSVGDVANGNMLQSEMIQRAGGINPAAELKSSELWPTAGTEQIFKWNPDYIFITNSESSKYSPEDILDNPAWSEINAVKTGDVYIMPAEYDSWEFPGIVSVLGTEYIMKTMYPDLVTDKQLEMDAKELYKLAYGKVFTREELGY